MQSKIIVSLLKSFTNMVAYIIFLLSLLYFLLLKNDVNV